jgi:hypothetical protein
VFFFFRIRELNPAVHTGETSKTTQIKEIMPTLHFIFLFIVFTQIYSNHNNTIIKILFFLKKEKTNDLIRNNYFRVIQDFRRTSWRQ